MKATRKILSFVLVAAMMLALALPVFSDNTTTYTITVTNATKDHTYAAYKVFDATYSENGNAVAYRYDGELPNNDYFAQDIKGYITVKDAAKDDNGKLTSGAIEFLATLVDMDSTPADSVKATGDTVVLHPDAAGYYYVTSTLGAAVTVDTAKPTATIIDKNQEPNWGNDGNGKVIIDTVPHCGNVEGDNHTHTEACYMTTENYVSYGDEVTFDIAVLATNFEGEEQVTHYCITDTAVTGFDLGSINDAEDKMHIVVTVDGKTLTEGVDYTVTKHQHVQTWGGAYPGSYTFPTYDGFDIDIKWANITTDGNGAITGIESIYPANSEIHVQYTATVADDTAGAPRNVVVGEDGNRNIANFTTITDKIGSEPDDDEPTYDPDNEKETKSYTYAIGLIKTFAGGQYWNRSGATFRLTKDPYAEDPEYLNLIKKIDSRSNPEVYYYVENYDPNDYIGKEYSEFTTNSSGVFTIAGLKPGTYYLVEVDTIDGYHICAEPIEFVIEEGAANIDKTEFDPHDGGGSYLIWDHGYQPAAVNHVVNESGTELPSTGGMGTHLFVISGLVLMLTAGIILITRKRMTNEES